MSVASIMKSKPKSGGKQSPGVEKIQPSATRGSRGASSGFIGSQVPTTMKGDRFFGGVKDNSANIAKCDIDKVGPQKSCCYLK